MSTKPSSDQGGESACPDPAGIGQPGQDIAETPDLQGAYPRLSDAQIPALAAQGRRHETRPEEVLFCEDDRDCDRPPGTSRGEDGCTPNPRF
jgi:hypothetical protein